jgi:uncharacterized protein (TIGR03435 family)
MSIQRVGGVLIVMLAATASLIAQNQTRVAFDVASVRIVETKTPSKRTILGSRVDLVSYPIREIVLMAYEVPAYRLVLPASVLDSQPWIEIHATLPAGATPKQLPAMLRTLLAERFGMVAHVESRPIDVGELTIGPGGLKMKEVAAADDRKKEYPVARGGPDSPPFDTMIGSENQTRMIMGPGGAMRLITADTNYERKDNGRGSTIYDATRVTMPQLVDMVSSSVGKPVIDRTGLTGFYQFTIELPRNPAIGATVARVLERSGITTDVNGNPIDVKALDAEPVAGSPSKAVEGLGLKLENRRLPFDVVVVDKLEKAPTPN